MSKYKVGDKVVLEITDKVEVTEEPWHILSDATSIFESHLDKAAEPLTAYTEPLEAKIRRQAAEITRLLRENNELKEQMKFDLPTLISEEDRRRMDINKARVEGAEVAWELAKKCMLMTDREREAIFGSGHNALYGVLTYFDYQHAAAKVAEWEKAKEEIKRGDVLEDMASSKVKCVVTNIYPSNMAYLVFNDGSAGIHELENMKKTGRHIDIDGFLKQIRGE